MAQALSEKRPRAGREKKGETITITRTFDAPRGLVWKAWTDPALIVRWWGPKGFTTPVAKSDFRVGGRYLYCMRAPDGKEIWSTGVFREIVHLQKTVATDSFADENGNVVPASYYGMEGEFPLELQASATFSDQKGRTKFVLRHGGFPPGEITKMTIAGWNEMFDKLETFLKEERANWEKTLLTAEPGKQEATIIRVFDAPREKVFRAYTNPELRAKWWAPRRLSIDIEKMEAKAGGSWRMVNRDKDGNEFWFHGVYHEVSPTRIVYTFEFEGMPEHVMLGIASLEDMDGKTKVTEKTIFESVDERDAMLKYDMEEGGREVMDRLAELIEKH